MISGRGFPFEKWWTLQLALICHDISPRAIIVFARLIEHHNHKTGLCYPTEETLASALSCSSRTIRTVIRELEQANLISTKKGRESPPRNHYTINFFRGDKNAYRKAEIIGLHRRKNSSGKPKKEPKNKGLRRKEIAKGGSNAFRKKATRWVSESETRQALENAVAARFKNSEEGFKFLLKIPEAVLDAAAHAVYSGQQSKSLAVNTLLKSSLED